MRNDSRHLRTRTLLAAIAVALLLATQRSVNGQEKTPARARGVTPIAVLNAVPGAGDGLDLLTSSTISLAAGADVFAYMDTGRLALGSLSRGRIFATLDDVSSYSLFPERSQLLLNMLAGQSAPVLLNLEDRRVIHSFDSFRDVPLDLLTPVANDGFVVAFQGSDYVSDHSDDAIVLFDVDRTATRKVAAACEITSQEDAWGKEAAIARGSRLYAVTGPCNGNERVALYKSSGDRAEWSIDSWKAETSSGTVAFNDDGSQLLHVHPFGQEFELFDTATGRRIGRWRSSDKPMRHVAVSERGVVMTLSDNDQEQLWQFRAGSSEPERNDSLASEGWRFLVAEGSRYLGPWAAVPGRKQALRVMVDGTLELVDRNTASVAWSIPVSRTVAVAHGSTPHFYVADQSAGELQEFAVSSEGVRWATIPFQLSCGDGCEVVRINQEQLLRVDHSDKASSFTLIDMRTNRSVASCAATASETVGGMDRAYLSVTHENQSRIVRWSDCRALWSGNAVGVTFIERDRALVTSDDSLLLLQLGGSGPRTLLEVPFINDDSSYQYSAPGLLVVNTEVPTKERELPKRRFLAYDLTGGTPKLLLEEQEECQPFGQGVAAYAPLGLVAIECDVSGAALIRHERVRLYRRHQDSLKAAAVLPMEIDGELVFAADGRLLVDAQGGPILTAWQVPSATEAPSSEPLFHLAVQPDGAWMAVGADGRFDTNELETNRLLSWVLPGSFSEPVAIEAFLRDYFEPQLIRKLIAKVDLPPAKPLASLNRVFPRVEFVKVSADKDDPFVVDVALRVEEGTASRASEGVVQKGIPSEVKLFLDGRLVGSSLNNRDFKLSDGAATIRFRARVHRTGERSQFTLTAYAYNQDSVKSESVVWLYERAAQVQPHKGRAVVLTIGVDATEAEGWDLSFAVNDARQLATVVSDSLRASDRYESVESILLRSIRKEDGTLDSTATKSGIANALARLAATAASSHDSLGPDDLLIVAISSHGISTTTGDFYLVPSDIGADARWPRLDTHRAISSSELSSWLAPVHAGSIALLIDACQSAGLIQREGFRPGPMGSRDFGQLAYDKGMLVLAAAESSEPAHEVGALKHGLLSYALAVDGLNKRGADWQPADGSIHLREWLAFAVERVPALASSLGVRDAQQPLLFDFVRRSVRGTILVAAPSGAR